MAIATVDPATGKTLETFDPLDTAGVEARLARAADAYARHRLTSFAERAALLRAAADVLWSDREATARIMTGEMGKPLAQALAEVGKCVKSMRWYADRASSLLADELPDPEDVADSGAVAAHVLSLIHI